MDDSKNPIALISFGVSIGAILVITLVVVFRATPTGINIGPVEFEIPTAMMDSPSSGISMATAEIPISPPIAEDRFRTTYEVFANLSWQDTGIQIGWDDRLRIVWDGASRWRGTDSGEFSDPLGGWIDTTNPQYACPPLMEPNEAGWNALVARIGEDGTPFNPFKLILAGEGTLYLAMNDCDSQRFDNEGSVIVTIEVSH